MSGNRFDNIKDLFPTLSSREFEILQDVCNGMLYPEISKKLFIAEGTIKSHMGSVYIKLGLGQVKRSEKRILLFQEICPALNQYEFPPDSNDQENFIGEIPLEIEKMVEEDQRALLVIDSNESDFKDYEAEIIKRENIQIIDPTPKSEPRLRRFPWGWLIIGLIIGAGLVYLILTRYFPPTPEIIVHTSEPFVMVESKVEAIEVTKIVTPTHGPKEPSPTVEQAIVVVTATAQPTPTSDVRNVEPGFVFEDDFETGPDPAWEVISGELGMRQGWYTVTKPFNEVKTEHFMILSEYVWNNVSIEIGIQSFYGDVQSFNGAGGIIFRYLEDGSGIGLIFYPKGYGLEFGILSPERQWTMLDGTQATGDWISADGTTITVEVKDDLYYAYINNKLVTFTQIPNTEAGKIGLFFRTNREYNHLDQYAPRIDWIRVVSLQYE